LRPQRRESKRGRSALLWRLEIFGTEFDHQLAGSQNMSLHGVDHDLAICPGGLKAEFGMRCNKVSARPSSDPSDAQVQRTKAPIDPTFEAGSIAFTQRSSLRVYLKYLRSGAFWPFSVGIRKPSTLII
jgi:hypothetical protein